jgi:hypothetical protein
VIRRMFADVEADVYVMVVAARPPPLCTFLRSPATHQNEVPLAEKQRVSRNQTVLSQVA